jgi:hypothetical protein
LGFDYVQPALSEHQHNCHTLNMAVHHSFLQQGGEEEKGVGDRRKKKGGLRSEVVLRFLSDFFTCLKGETALTSDPDYLSMHSQLSSRSFVSTILPLIE